MYIKNRRSALKFVEYGNSQIKASRILMESKKYKEAIFFFQQASENTTKALGYFCLNINPHNVRHTPIEISKQSINEFMLEMEEFKNYPEKQKKELKSDFDLLELLSNLLVSSVDKVYPTAKAAVTFIDNLENMSRDILYKRDMWLKTLYINDIESKEALDKALKFSTEYNSSNFDSIYNITKTFIRSFFGSLSKLPQIKKIIKYAREMSYLLKSTVLAVDLFHFNYLSYMHQQPTRYPKSNPRDYWDNDAYTEDAELVKRLPELILQLEALNKEAYKLINEF